MPCRKSLIDGLPRPTHNPRYIPLWGLVVVKPVMKRLLLLLLIATAHIAFLFSAYGTKFFGLPLPSAVAPVVWLGASSLAAGLAYYSASAKTPSARSAALAIVATGASLYTGMFLAFNTFGT